MSGNDAGVDVVQVDAHAHVMRRDAPLASERHSAPKYDVSAADFLSLLDRHRISHGVLTAPSFYGADNSLLLAALAEAPERLRGTAIVAPDIAREALAEMDRQGIVGIRLNWFRRHELPDVTSPEYASLFAAVRDLGWHVEVYLEGSKLAGVLPRLRASGATIVVDHFGSPDPALRVACGGFREVLAGVRAGDTFVKLSAPYRLGGADPQAYVDALLDAGGPGQLVWASDFPFVGFEDSVAYADCVALLAQWIPDAATRRIVAATTPAALFRFDTPT